MYLILPAALGPGVYSGCNRNESQEHKNNNVSGIIKCGGEGVLRKADNLTAICEPIV
jgi:hypothetical protein